MYNTWFTQQAHHFLEKTIKTAESYLIGSTVVCKRFSAIGPGFVWVNDNIKWWIKFLLLLILYMQHIFWCEKVFALISMFISRKFSITTRKFEATSSMQFYTCQNHTHYLQPISNSTIFSSYTHILSVFSSTFPKRHVYMIIIWPDCDQILPNTGQSVTW